MTATTLTVALDERSYPIHIGQGLLSSFDLATVVTGPAALIVTNDIVAPLYLSRVTALLPDRDLQQVILKDGEQHKTLQAVAGILDALANARAGRDTTVIALGGGVVGDIAGFAAACYMRGVPFIQVPTTLLAQVDSSVGGKTGVNHPRGKNLIGAFHQPRLVLIDTETLSTLPDRELSAGLAEVIKHAAIADGEFFHWLEANVDSLLKRNADALGYAIRRCCEIKAAVVAEDERESGKRALLNFGHTFGHAIENSLGYGEWLHGEAVAAGMVMAAELSELPGDARQRLHNLIERAGLPTEPPPVAADKLRAAIGIDKKIIGKRLRFILLRELGEAFIDDNISEDRLSRILDHAKP
ncbi:MAG: 3-dehydroquinate synthase [Woeseia sp.]|nr:3-dehydroquinate synthase [Woeseia sp.]MBT8096092.1 3-dehydroquinate synthase [Woeseia sp.]NNE60691.1 3-dehydroquinate synthase [Woeseia sp.]NNL54726.1 3-dehydroquinate synthase [Woeseia sp.]